MLNEQSKAIVKSTAPILQEHGEALTKHFYKRMFLYNPEVIPFFNGANQEAGLQQKALAGAICAYAANIDNLEILGSTVELIAQKHVSLQIKPEHYPIVGENLIASIREVLGEGATEEVVNAWNEAYGFLAEIMIAREKQIYTEHVESPGGWEGFKSFKVIKKEKENDLITSFYLTPSDEIQLPDFQPGQYITIKVKTPGGSTTMRNYSLSDTPGKDWFRITVKKEIGLKAEVAEGYVSNYLHNEIGVNSKVEIAQPSGEFVLKSTSMHDRNLIFIAAGVGITPIYGMLTSALMLMPDKQINFIHACQNENSHVFKKSIDELVEQYPNLTVQYRYSNPLNLKHVDTGFIDETIIESLIQNKDADFYFCGPKEFMVNVYNCLVNKAIPLNQINFEFFGPRQEFNVTNKKGCPI